MTATITVLDKDLYLLTVHFSTKDLGINQIERIGGGRDDYRVTEEERMRKKKASVINEGIHSRKSLERRKVITVSARNEW